MRALLIEVHGQLPSEARTGRPFPVPPSTAPPTRQAPPGTGGYAGVGAPTSADTGEPPWRPASPSPYTAPPYPAPQYGAPYGTPPPYGVPAGGGYWSGGGPMPAYPVALPPPPTPLIVGAWLLRASGLLAVTLAVIYAITYDQVQEAWTTAYSSVAPESANNNSGGLIVYIILAVAQVIFSILLARALTRGVYASRVIAICFIGIVDVGCCVAGALPVELNQPGGTDFRSGTSQLAIDGANTAFTRLFPASFTIGSAVICIVGALMLAAALILILVPSSAAFFRAWRGRFRAPARIRVPYAR